MGAIIQEVDLVDTSKVINEDNIVEMAGDGSVGGALDITMNEIKRGLRMESCSDSSYGAMMFA